MEVLTSTNRISATTFLSLSLLANRALDCNFNTMGPANNTIQGFFITYFITFTFLLLCLVPFRVQLVTGCDKLHKLHFSKFFTGVFMKILCVLNIAIGLYWVARQCRQFHAPMPKSKGNKQELNQRPIQSAPLTDEYTTGFQIRLTLVLDEYSPLLAPLTTGESTSKTVSQQQNPQKTRLQTMKPLFSK